MKLKNSCVRTLTCTAVVLGAAAMLSRVVDVCLCGKCAHAQHGGSTQHCSGGGDGTDKFMVQFHLEYLR